MRLLHILPIAFLSALSAQTPVNVFEIHSGCSNYTDRGSINANAGEMLFQVPSTFFNGVGHDAAGQAAAVSGFRYVTQDQNASTQETYFLVVRAHAATGGPVYPGNPLLRAGPLQTPLASGAAAWIVTATLQTPATIPLCDTYYVGGEMAAAPLWVNNPPNDDGQSFHIGTYYQLGGTQGDNPAPTGATNLAWSVNYATQTATQPTYLYAMQFGVSVTSAVLNLGNVDPNALTTNCVSTQAGVSWGAGGLWPQCSGSSGPRNDGLNMRLRDAASANGVFALLIGAHQGCPGLPLGGLANGALYLNPAIFATVLSGSLDNTGLATAVILPPNSPACPVDRFTRFQTFSVGSSFTLPGNLSNMASTRYLP